MTETQGELVLDASKATFSGDAHFSESSYVIETEQEGSFSDGSGAITNMTFPKTFVSFSGGDCTPYLNGTLLTDFNSISYIENLTDGTIKGEIKLVTFTEHIPLADRFKDKDNTIEVEFKNEYNEHLAWTFKDVVLTTRGNSVGVSSFYITEIYTFKAECIIYS